MGLVMDCADVDHKQVSNDISDLLRCENHTQICLEIGRIASRAAHSAKQAGHKNQAQGVAQAAVHLMEIVADLTMRLKTQGM